MRHLLAALLLIFGFVGTGHAEPISTKEFDLESNFCIVVAKIMQNPDTLSPSEIHQKVPIKKGVAFKKDKGLIWYQINRNQITSRNEELWFKTYLAVSKKSLVIVSVLDSESVKLKESVMQMEFHDNGSGTTVKYSLWVDADVNPFFLRIGARAQLFRMEKALRELVGEPLEDEKDE